MNGFSVMLAMTAVYCKHTEDPRPVWLVTPCFVLEVSLSSILNRKLKEWKAGSLLF